LSETLRVYWFALGITSSTCRNNFIKFHAV